MSYEAWRATFQSSEQAARTAYQELQSARAQSGQVVEPVAWSWEYRGLHVSTDKAFVEKIAADGFAIRPLVFADTQTSQQGGVPDEWLELLARRAEDSDITYEATYDPGYDKPIHHDCDIEERVADWIRDQKGKTSQPAQQGSVPDYVNEALQRLIENGGNLGPASREDALVVARYRRELLATPQPEGDGWLRLPGGANNHRCLLYTPSEQSEIEYRIVPAGFVKTVSDATHYMPLKPPTGLKRPESPKEEG